MVRARRLLSFALAVSFWAGCDAGPGDDPAGTLTIEGVLVDETGAPVVGAVATARPALTPQEVITPRLTELDELGFACIDERPPSACREHRRTARTAPGGEFALEFGVTEALGGGPAVMTTAEPMTVSLHLDPTDSQLSGPATSREILPDESGAGLGQFVLWNPSLVLETVNGTDAVLRWDRAPAAEVAGYRVLVENSEGKLVLYVGTTAQEMTLALPTVADTRGAVSVVALGKDRPERWRSARVPYRADDGSVRLAGVDDVGWPLDARLAPGVVLLAIGAFLGANITLVVAANARHRRHLATIPVRRRQRARR